MAFSFKAILLKKLDYGDHNMILQTYTRERGNVAFFAYRSNSKNKKKSALPPLAILNITASKGKGDLYRVKEIGNEYVLNNLMTDVYKSCMVLFINEVLIKTIRDYHQDEGLYDFIQDALRELNEVHEKYFNFHLSFLMEFTRHLGFYPNGTRSEAKPFFDLYEGTFTEKEPLHSQFIPPDDSDIFRQLLQNRHLNDERLKLDNDKRKVLLSYILDYYRTHVDQFDQLKSTEVLEQVLA